MTEVLPARERVYPAPAAFAAAANVGPEVYTEAQADPVAFWERAADRLQWSRRWHTAHTWSPAVATPPGPDGSPRGLSVPAAEWFVGGRLNVAVNCVDRHVAAGNGDRVALYFEGEPGDRQHADLRRPAA